MRRMCPECGFSVAGDASGCRAAFEELIARDFSDVRFGRVHRLMVDVYCVQHPDRHCVSAKSLAAHLGGLCCAIEHASHPGVHHALRRWINGGASIEKPALPDRRGSLNIGHVRAAQDPQSYAKALDEWARSAWDAHAALHPLARQWMQAALESRPVAR